MHDNYQYFGVRFTPTVSCKVIAGKVRMGGSGQCSLFVYNVDVFNEPGTRVATTAFTSSSGWKTVNFSTQPSYSSDFFIVIALPPDVPHMLGLDQALDCDSRMVVAREAGMWSKGVPGWGIDTDFMIRAIVSAVSSITVTKPDGGESWLRESSHDITWTSDGVSGNVDIELWKGGVKDSDIVTISANPALYNWAIPASQTPGTDYKMRVISVNDPSIWDESNNNFSITEPITVITVTDPDGGESWTAGSSHNITWASNGVSGNVKIELYKGGSFNSTIANDTANDSLYNWAIPASQSPGTDYKVRITSIDNSSIWDESNGDFSITEPSGIRVIKPDGGESWARGNSYDITWTSGTPESVWDTVDYSVSSPHPYPNSYDTTWIISDAGAEKMEIHFSEFNTLSGDYVYLYDKADNQIISYNGNLGAFWSQEVPSDTAKVRLVSNFMWNAYGFDIDKYAAFHAGEGYNVKIELYKGGNLNSTIANDTPNNSLYSWAIPASQTTGTDYKVRITSVINPSIWDESNSDFSIIDVGTEEEVTPMPKVYWLSQTYPNPAIQKTEIRFQVPGVRNQKLDIRHLTSNISLKVYDMGGRLVKTLIDEKKGPGYYQVVWNMRDNTGKQLSSGIYFYKLETPKFTATRKLIIVQ